MQSDSRHVTICEVQFELPLFKQSLTKKVRFDIILSPSFVRINRAVSEANLSAKNLVITKRIKVCVEATRRFPFTEFTLSTANVFRVSVTNVLILLETCSVENLSSSRVLLPLTQPSPRGGEGSSLPLPNRERASAKVK